MRLSDLGLTPDEVNSIMADMAGGGQTVTSERQPETTKAPGAPQQEQAVIRVNEATPAIDNTKSKDVGISLIPPGKKVGQPPPSVIPVGVQPPKAEKKPGAGLILAAAGAGFLVGGPVGAAVGAGAGWLLGKGATPAPVPPKPMTQTSTPQAIVPAAVLGPAIVQVTPTSTKSPTVAPAARTDAAIKTTTATRLVSSTLASRAGIVIGK